jgi:precorrin-6A/cobalt-precorrin-6A reductase
MNSKGKTLVLAGAREAHGVIAGLVLRGRSVVASLPELERSFDPLPVPTRVGRFDSPEAFGTWISDEGIDRVIDASHGFDSDISETAHSLCRSAGLPYLRVLRTVWSATRMDQWTSFSTVVKAVEAVPEGARVFSNTGRATLNEYAAFKGQVVFLRVTNNSSDVPPFAFMKLIHGSPPFSQRQEETLFSDLRITRLICRNVGGAASMSKLLAARKLGIRVLMIHRPTPPAGAIVVETVTEALAWEANG